MNEQRISAGMRRNQGRAWTEEERVRHSQLMRGKKNARARKPLRLPPDAERLSLSELLLQIPARTIGVHDFAELIGVSDLTVYRQIRRGAVPGILRFGCSVRLDTVRLAEWIKAQEHAWGTGGAAA